MGHRVWHPGMCHRVQQPTTVVRRINKDLPPESERDADVPLRRGSGALSPAFAKEGADRKSEGQAGADKLVRLDHHRPLTDIPPHRWRQFLSDCNNFLTGDENWAGRAAELGWNAATLFGCRTCRDPFAASSIT